MGEDDHNYFFGDWPEMPWKKGAISDTDATSKVSDHPLTEAELHRAIRNAEERAYRKVPMFRLVSKKEYNKIKRKLWLRETLRKIRQRISGKFS